MEVPILKQGNILIASVQSALADADLLHLQRRLSERAGKTGIKGIVVDVSALDVLDSFASRTLSRTAQILKLRGAQTVIVGINPDVAFSMVQLGLKLEGVPTALDLEEGLLMLNQGLPAE